jgi:hypothetical protein
MRLTFCAACGIERDLQDHHLVPRAAGGSDDLTNIITLCTPCHWRVHDQCWPANKSHSELTRNGLTAAKARGVKLGNPRLSEASAKADTAAREAAERFAANVVPIIEQIRASGITGFRGVARALTARGVKTARGGQWTARAVINVLER